MPLFLVPASAGAPMPGNDHVEQMVTAADLLGLNDQDTVFSARVVGDSMKGAGIFSGDSVVVHQQSPKPGDIIVCSFNGEMMIKRFEQVGEGGQVWLYSENADYKPVKVLNESEPEVFGVVQRLVRTL